MKTIWRIIAWAAAQTFQFAFWDILLLMRIAFGDTPEDPPPGSELPHGARFHF